MGNGIPGGRIGNIPFGPPAPGKGLPHPSNPATQTLCVVSSHSKLYVPVTHLPEQEEELVDRMRQSLLSVDERRWGDLVASVASCLDQAVCMAIMRRREVSVSTCRPFQGYFITLEWPVCGVPIDQKCPVMMAREWTYRFLQVLQSPFLVHLAQTVQAKHSD